MKKINLMNLSKEAVVAFLVAVVTLINIVSLALGFNPINISENDIYQLVSGLAPFVALLPVAWKNFNLTDAAVDGQEVTDAEKTQDSVVSDIDEEA